MSDLAVSDQYLPNKMFWIAPPCGIRLDALFLVRQSMSAKRDSVGLATTVARDDPVWHWKSTRGEIRWPSDGGLVLDTFGHGAAIGNASNHPCTILVCELVVPTCRNEERRMD